METLSWSAIRRDRGNNQLLEHRAAARVVKGSGEMTDVPSQ
jgi:hypothetical protein